MSNPLALDDYAAIMTPKLYARSRPDTSCYVSDTQPVPGRSHSGIEPTFRRPIGSSGPTRTLSPTNDNTVGPVTLASGYGSNGYGSTDLI